MLAQMQPQHSKHEKGGGGGASKPRASPLPPPHPQATKAKISDAQSRVETLRSEEASNAESIRKAQRTRADAALKV